MVVEVLADPGQVGDDRDLESAQHRTGPHPGEHEQLRRVVGAAAEDDLAPGPELERLAEPCAADADGAATLDEHAVDLDVGLDGDVGTLRRGMQIGDRGAAAAAATLGDLVEAGAVLLGAVEVVVAGESRPLGAGTRMGRTPDPQRRRGA